MRPWLFILAAFILISTPAFAADKYHVYKLQNGECEIDTRDHKKMKDQRGRLPNQLLRGGRGRVPLGLPGQGEPRARGAAQGDREAGCGDRMSRMPPHAGGDAGRGDPHHGCGRGAGGAAEGLKVEGGTPRSLPAPGRSFAVGFSDGAGRIRS